MYTYRKKIQLSHAATAGTSSVNILNLSGLATNKIADVEIKATLFDVASSKTSVQYYRYLQVVDPSALPGAGVSNNSSFFYNEDTSTSAYLFSISYVQVSSTIAITANNTTGSTRNTICIIDYKINFY